MDWEGGTIGVIVPALMGHGEAGRASPWPFFFGHSLMVGLLGEGFADNRIPPSNLRLLELQKQCIKWAQCHMSLHR
ncbi:hypothetical protein CA13_42990 [Planctomycetes bacterium CA13]|uniref:Uncharacterized protein n=1 Tax=Novipirellula herctigrandis TaxID=2527986 RepID=A0A5C5Z704_9BACT|nr:hypothetical protein CA13_42990 [Planctomycetes bacterium CA13]